MRDSRGDRQWTGSDRHVSRRGYLSSALGALGLAVAGCGRSVRADPGSTTDSNYETITVPPGGHFAVRVADGGRFENTLVDITAPGATWEVEALGADWQVRNLGIRGVWDSLENAWPLSVAVDAGAVGRVENFYFGDGAVDDTYPGVTGIYARHYHAGRLQIDRVNIQGMAGNAVYASTPGYPDDDDPVGKTRPTGGGGTVEITDSFASNCLSSHFRIGTDGSFVRNCVARGGDRGVWARFGDTRVVDSDLSRSSDHPADGDIVCGTNNWESGEDATVTVENTVYETTGQDIEYAGTILGTSADRELRTDPPTGAPTTPEAAASGGDNGNASTTTKHLRVESVDSGPWIQYEFTVDGSVEKAAYANPSDEIDGGDGRTTVTGMVGQGGTDDYRFDGSLLSWDADADHRNYRVVVTETVTPDDSRRESILTVASPTHGPTVRYDFTVDGTFVHCASTERSDGRSTVNEQARAWGRVESGTHDTYVFQGTLLDWWADVDSMEYFLFLDGQEITPDSGLVGG